MLTLAKSRPDVGVSPQVPLSSESGDGERRRCRESVNKVTAIAGFDRRQPGGDWACSGGGELVGVVVAPRVAGDYAAGDESVIGVVDYHLPAGCPLLDLQRRLARRERLCRR